MDIDSTTGRNFLKCEYNRDGDSYRSPWSNKYFPCNTENPVFPTSDLLQLEQKANDVFARYATLYFDSGATTSVYMFDTDYEGFGAAFLVKKSIEGEKGIKEGTWDSIHVVSVVQQQNKKATYRVASTVFLKMVSSSPVYGNLEIAGTLSKLVSHPPPYPSY